MDLWRCRHHGIVQVLAVVLPRKLINHLIHVKSINAPKGAFFVEIYSLALRVTFFLASWLIPNHYPPWVGFHNEALMFSARLMFCAYALLPQILLDYPNRALASCHTNGQIGLHEVPGLV